MQLYRCSTARQCQKAKTGDLWAAKSVNYDPYYATIRLINYFEFSVKMFWGPKCAAYLPYPPPSKNTPLVVLRRSVAYLLAEIIACCNRNGRHFGHPSLPSVGYAPGRFIKHIRRLWINILLSLSIVK